MKAKFEKVSRFKDVQIDVPVRKTSGSAAYDMVVAEETVVPSIFAQNFGILKQLFINDEFFVEHILDRMVNPEYVKAFVDHDTGAISKFLLDDLLPEIRDILSVDLEEAKVAIKRAGAKATLVSTGYKVRLGSRQVCKLYIRSSTPYQALLVLGNSVGIIDSDYYNNVDNEGEIFFQLINLSPFSVTLKKGDIIGQAELSTFEVTEDDISEGTRESGFGSTTNKSTT